MLTPEEEYMIRVNTLKYADELLAMVESLVDGFDSGSFIVDADRELIHKAELLIKDIKG